MELNNSDIFTQAINFVKANPLIVFGILLIVAFILIFYMLFKNRERIKAFKPIPLEAILRKQFDDLVKMVKVEGNFSHLRKGEVTIGRIVTVGLIKFFSKGNKGKEDITKRLLILKISFNPNIPIISNILDSLGVNTRYAVIPYDVIKLNSYENRWGIKTYINIPNDLEVYSFADIYIYGYEVYKFVNSVSWLYARRSELEELVNYPKRIVFLEAMHTKKVDELEQIYSLEEKKFKSKMGSLAPSLKD